MFKLKDTLIRKVNQLVFEIHWLFPFFQVLQLTHTIDTTDLEYGPG